MKAYIYIATAILLLISNSCVKEQDFLYDEPEIISIKGIEPSYSKLAFVDRLEISPVVATNDPNAQFDYFWGIYTPNPANDQTIDTIARTKDLDYQVTQSAGQLGLVFGVKNLNTGYQKLITSSIEVGTPFTRGWYVLKSSNGFSDIDHFSTPESIQPQVRTDNVFSVINNRKLKGEALSLSFYNDYSNVQNYRSFRSLIVLTESDISVLSINEMKEEFSSETVFFSAPEQIKPSAFLSSNWTFLLVNDGEAYSIFNNTRNTGQFGLPKLRDAENSPYRLSKYFISFFLKNGIFFDELSSTFLTTDGINNTMIPVSSLPYPMSHIPAANNNKTVLYMGSRRSNPVSFDPGWGILQDKTDPSDRVLAEINSMSPAGSPFTIKITPITSDEKLYNGNLFTLNHEEMMMYFVSGNELWSRNLLNQNEQLQFSPPAGESISFVRHRIYNEGDFSFNFVLVGTITGSNYKVYMFNKSAGNLLSNPEFILDGEGEVGDVIYIAPGVNSNTYPNTY